MKKITLTPKEFILFKNVANIFKMKKFAQFLLFFLFSALAGTMLLIGWMLLVPFMVCYLIKAIWHWKLEPYDKKITELFNFVVDTVDDILY